MNAGPRTVLCGIIAALVFGSYGPASGASSEKTTILWERALPDQARGGVVVGDGKVYVAIMDKTLRAFAIADGQQRWKVDLGAVPRTGAAYADGVVLLVDASRRLRAFSADTGAEVWEATLRGQASSGITAGNGVVLIGEGNKSCSAFDLKNGRVLWQVAVLGDVVAPPWSGEEYAVFGSTGHKLYAVAKLSGEVLKEIVLKGEIHGRFGVAKASPEGSRVFAVVGTHDHKLQAFSRTWKPRWLARCRGIVRAAPIVGPKAIYAGTDESFLYAFKRERGSMMWRIGVGGPVVDRLVPMGSRLAVGAGGTLKFVNPKKGRIEQVIEMDGIVQGIDGAEGMVVVVTGNRRLVGVGVREPEKAAAKTEMKTLASVLVDPYRLNARRGESVVLSFSLLKAGPLTVEVVGSRGRRVKMITERKRAWPDTYRFSWDGSDDNGGKVAPGVYRIRVKTSEEDVSVGVDVVGRR